jgi:hypothetical protein
VITRIANSNANCNVNAVFFGKKLENESGSISEKYMANDALIKSHRDDLRIPTESNAGYSRDYSFQLHRSEAE